MTHFLPFCLFFGQSQTESSFKWSRDSTLPLSSYILMSCMFSLHVLMCVIDTGSVMSLTSAADGGQSSWFLSEIPAAELSALRSAGDHQCYYLCFHSPAACTHTQSNAKLGIKKLLFAFELKAHKHMLGTSRAITDSVLCCSTYPRGCISRNSVLLWQGTLKCKYKSTNAKKMSHDTTTFTAMQNKSPDISVTQTENLTLSRIMWFPLLYQTSFPALTVWWSQNISVYFTHEAECYLTSRLVVWFSLPPLIRQQKLNLHAVWHSM